MKAVSLAVARPKHKAVTEGGELMATKKTTTKPKAATKTTAKKPATRSAAPKKTTKKKTTAATKKATTSRPKKVEKVPVMTKAEQLCQNVNPDLKAQAITLANAVLTMQEKIEQQIPNYKTADLAQEVTVGTGEKMLRQNPLTQEFRATVRDYATALNNLEEILESKPAAQEASAVEQLRNRFKVG